MRPTSGLAALKSTNQAGDGGKKTLRAAHCSMVHSEEFGAAHVESCKYK